MIREARAPALLLAVFLALCSPAFASINIQYREVIVGFHRSKPIAVVRASYDGPSGASGVGVYLWNYQTNRVFHRKKLVEIDPTKSRKGLQRLRALRWKKLKKTLQKRGYALKAKYPKLAANQRWVRLSKSAFSVRLKCKNVWSRKRDQQGLLCQLLLQKQRAVFALKPKLDYTNPLGSIVGYNPHLYLDPAKKYLLYVCKKKSYAFPLKSLERRFQRALTRLRKSAKIRLLGARGVHGRPQLEAQCKLYRKKGFACTSTGYTQSRHRGKKIFYRAGFFAIARQLNAKLFKMKARLLPLTWRARAKILVVLGATAK